MHMISILAIIALGAGVSTLLVWEVYRHRREIGAALRREWHGPRG